MSKKSKKNYPQEFRDKAVRLVNECGYTIDQVAEQFGCSKESVRRWKAAVQPKLDPETVLLMELEEDENKRLRKEVARLKMANIALLLRRLAPAPNVRTYHYHENSSNA